MVEDGACPSRTGPQHVTVAEPTTTCKAGEICQIGTSVHQIRHRHIDGFATCFSKGGCHFHVSIDALLTQNRHSRSTFDDSGGLAKLKSYHRLATGILAISKRQIFFLCRRRFVAPCLHAPREL